MSLRLLARIPALSCFSLRGFNAATKNARVAGRSVAKQSLPVISPTSCLNSVPAVDLSSEDAIDPSCSHCETHHEPFWPYGGRGHRDPQTHAPALCIESLGVRYPHAEAWALHEVELTVKCGERVALVGPNGAGKSTLLRTICGLHRPIAGTIRVFGNPVGACHHRTAFLPQRSEVDWRFPITVTDLVMTGRYVHLGWLKRPQSHDRDLVQAMLQRLKIDSLADRQIGQLSGGQQQRTLLARALVQESSLFLLDEPLNAVDESTREIIDDVLTEQAQRGRAIVASTHDPGWLANAFDRAVYLEAGRVTRIKNFREECP